MLRLAGGVVLGYAIFALTAVLLFQIAGRDPHAAADPPFMVGSIGAGTIAALAGGYVGAAVAKRRERTAGLVLALVIASAAGISLVARPDEGSRWSPLAALLLMAPAAALGAVIRSHRVHVR